MTDITTIWKYKEYNRQNVYDLVEALEIPMPIATVLSSRGINTPKKYKKFTDLDIKKLHNSFSLPDINPVVERLSKAIDNQEKIFVWGDYDVDGITSTAIIVTALKKMGANLDYKVPHRMEDGYDIKVDSVNQALAAGAKLLMSVDCGILAFETADYAKASGLDLIITDHHHPSDDGRIPDCIGVVNPNRDDPKYPGEHFKEYATEDFKRYPFDYLAGCGIAFKVMLALAKFRNLNLIEYLNDTIEFAALGTVADVAPMLDENRVIVKYGCSVLNNSSKPGIRELMVLAGVQDVNVTSIGFQIGPRINAIGRLADSNTALHLLLSEDDFTAKMLAKKLDNTNKTRQTQQEENIQQAISLVESTYDLEKDHIIVIGDKGWHPGLIGLIAGKIAEMFNKPTLVCSYKEDGYAKGSCRSVANFNILEALKSPEAIKLFKKKNDGSPVMGGHAFAAGFELPISNMEAMREVLNKYTSDKVGEPAKEKIIEIDSKILFDDINLITYAHMMKMAPFGSMNITPVFSCKNVSVFESKLISNGKHLKLKISNGEKNWIPCNAWRKGHLHSLLNQGTKIDIAFNIEIDTWMNKNALSLNIIDIVVTQ
jgi:single-stranded-DNA-specific exonuclease